LEALTGDDLRKIRERLGLTQRQCAILADVTERTWIRWETGAVPIAQLTARGLRSLFDEVRAKRREARG